MKYRIFKYICSLIIITLISVNIVISISNIKADSDSTSETIKYEGYWKEVSKKYENKEDSLNALHQLTRLPSINNDEPSITVLVHGYDGDASHWSNNSDWKFAYDSNSLIEELRNSASGANVYLARFTSTSMVDIVMQRCDEVDNQYVFTNLDKIDDVSKHTILVFESRFTDSYHRDVYAELHEIIDLVSYDILHLTGRIPKVNFISHSRGGLISMMYASGYRENGKIKNVEYTIDENENYIYVGDKLYEIPCDYDWYSSNESVALVTNYGTVLAMPVNEDTTVTIYVALKEDPSIVYYKTFTILNDEEDDLIEIEMSYSYSEENGTYQLELNNTNCPYPMIQYYSWNIINESEEIVTINYWGQISSTGPSSCIIIGTYILNPRVKLYINLIIE